MRLPNFVSVPGAALLLVLLSGCVPPGAATPPDSTATFVAPYATDEEALAAAEEAYADYTRVSDQILHDGGADPERIAAVTVGSLLDKSLESSNDQRAAGHVASGNTTFDDVELQRYSPGGPASEVISVYLCEDVSQVKVRNGAGESVVSLDRADTILLQVTFDYIAQLSMLKVSGVERWQDEPC